MNIDYEWLATCEYPVSVRRGLATEERSCGEAAVVRLLLDDGSMPVCLPHLLQALFIEIKVLEEG